MTGCGLYSGDFYYICINLSKVSPPDSSHIYLLKNLGLLYKKSVVSFNCLFWPVNRLQIKVFAA